MTKGGQDAGPGQSVGTQVIKSHRQADVPQIPVKRALHKGAPDRRRNAQQPTAQPATEKKQHHQGDKRQPDDGRVELTGQGGVGNCPEDHCRNSQVINEAVRRSQKRRRQKTIGPGNDTDDHDTENGNDRGYDVAHKTQSFSVADMKAYCRKQL
jgi:hypothetical protein